MQLRTLQLFCRVAELRSFSEGARACAMTQSAASQAIHQLEHELGVSLIDRSHRPLMLTAAGSLYYRGVRPLLHDYSTIESEVRSLAGAGAQRVTVAAIYSAGLSYIPDATAELRTRLPGVEIETEYAHVERVMQAVAEGAADLGLVSYARGTRDIVATTWQEEPMRLVCSPEHPWARARSVTLDQLTGQSLIGFERRLRIQQEIESFLAARGVRPRLAMQFDNIDSLIRAIQASRGIGILPEPTIRREVAAGSLCPVGCEQLTLKRPLGIIHRRGATLGRAALEFAEVLLGRPLPGAETASRARGGENGTRKRKREDSRTGKSTKVHVR